MKFRNVSPLGALDLALVGRVVAPGEVITVTAAQAVHLAGQDGTWQPVDDEQPVVVEAPAEQPPAAEPPVAAPPASTRRRSTTKEK